MKKLFSCLLVILLLVSLVSCGAAMDAENGGFKNNSSASGESIGNDLAERKIIRRVGRKRKVYIFSSELIFVEDTKCNLSDVHKL